jgi:hypothetical protein
MPTTRRSAASRPTNDSEYARHNHGRCSKTLNAGCVPHSSKLSRKSDTAAAILYALKLWPALARYCDVGSLEIGNSAAERALRGVAIGRRNYLFAGADSGGERAATIYSLIGNAKLNGIDPEAWLRHMLAHIADHPVNRVDDFLPGGLRDADAVRFQPRLTLAAAAAGPHLQRLSSVRPVGAEQTLTLFGG